MSNKPRLVLHIGMPKAGSTRVQDFISLNIDAFKASGYLMCDFFGRFDQALDRYAAPNGFFQRFMEQGKAGAAGVRAMIEQGVAELQDGQSLLVSAECLAGPPYVRLFHDIGDLVDIEVLVHIRRRDDWLVSSWGQWRLKVGQTFDTYIQQWCERPRWEYKRMIDLWSAVPSAQVTHVIPMHKDAYAHGDQCLDFASRLGVEADGLKLPGRVNVGLPFTVLSMLQRYPEIFDGKHDSEIKRLITTYFPELSSQNERDPLGTKIRQTLFDLHREEYEWLSAEHCTGDDLCTLFGVDTDTPVEPFRPSAEDMASLALAISLAIARGQERRLNALEQQLSAVSQISQPAETDQPTS